MMLNILYIIKQNRIFLKDDIKTFCVNFNIFIPYPSGSYGISFGIHTP